MCGDVASAFLRFVWGTHDLEGFASMGVTTFEHRSVPSPLAMAVLAAAALDLTAVASAQQPGPTPPPVTAPNRSTKLPQPCIRLSKYGYPRLGGVQPTYSTRAHTPLRQITDQSGLVRKGSSLSAVQNQWRDIPEEWEQGASGIGQTVTADIMGQYAIRKTVNIRFREHVA